MSGTWDVEGVFIGTVRGRKTIRRVRVAIDRHQTAWHIEPYETKRPAVISPDAKVRQFALMLVEELIDESASISPPNPTESPEARQAG